MRGNQEILDVMTMPSGNKIFSSDVSVQDEVMMNKCHVERSLKNEEFVSTNSVKKSAPTTRKKSH